MRCFKILKHDRFAAELVELVKDDYHRVEQNLSFYSRRNRLIAEIDVVGHSAKAIDVYEVKCGYRITKAKKQLYKIRKILRREYNQTINLFFYHGGSGELIQVG